MKRVSVLLVALALSLVASAQSPFSAVVHDYGDSYAMTIYLPGCPANHTISIFANAGKVEIKGYGVGAAPPEFGTFRLAASVDANLLTVKLEWEQNGSYATLEAYATLDGPRMTITGTVTGAGHLIEIVENGIQGLEGLLLGELSTSKYVADDQTVVITFNMDNATIVFLPINWSAIETAEYTMTVAGAEARYTISITAPVTGATVPATTIATITSLPNLATGLPLGPAINPASVDVVTPSTGSITCTLDSGVIETVKFARTVPPQTIVENLGLPAPVIGPAPTTDADVTNPAPATPTDTEETGNGETATSAAPGENIPASLLVVAAIAILAVVIAAATIAAKSSTQ